MRAVGKKGRKWAAVGENGGKREECEKRGAGKCGGRERSVRMEEGTRGREVGAEVERKRDVRKGEMGNVSERERGMRMMWKKERKEVKGWDRTVREEMGKCAEDGEMWS